MTETAAAGRSELHVGWLMPTFFHPLPVDVEDHGEVPDLLVELARTVLADHSSDEQHFFAQVMLRHTAQLIDAKAEYAGMCFVEHDGEPTMATVIANRVPSLGETVEDAAEAIKNALKRRYIRDDIRTEVLPLDNTPAVTRIGGIEVSIPAELSPDGEGQTLTQGVVQTYVPLPGQGETLVLELNTPSRNAWDMYREMFTAIVETLDWATDEQLAEEREVERITGLFSASETSTQTPRPQPEPVDEDVVRALRRCSSLVLDAVGIRGPIREEADELASVACAACRRKGLTSGCTARHHWEMTQLPPETLQLMLTAARAYLTRKGVSEDEGTSERRAVFTVPGDSVSAQGYTVTLTTDTGQRLLLVDVATSCQRGTSTTLVDDFG